MRFFKTHSNDVFYNLAFEEYVFENYRDDDYLILWTNDSSVVMGKFQNAYEEINLKAAEESGIKVARRNTGGGTVFHDKGNLNYSLIMDYDEELFAKYDSFLEPMIKALNKLGVPAGKRNKSDIAIGEEKISGSAQSVSHNRILHHGTLLFDADLSSLHELLKPTSGKITSKAVKSVRSKVVNIKDYIKTDNMTLADLESYLIENLFPGETAEAHLGEDEIEEIKKRKEEKYITWKWNYGKSPCFTFSKESRIEGRDIRIDLKVESGHIKECTLSLGTDKQAMMQELLLQKKILGEKYTYKGLKKIISQVIPAYQVDAFADCFF